MIFVGLGGGLGAVTRYLLGAWIGKRQKGVFPIATFIINVTGSFLLGCLARQYDYANLPEWIWLLLGAGFLGGYTTFSTFGNESITLFLNKKYTHGILYILGSVLLSILAAYIGYQL